jgi:ubiquinone biosynthesis protein
MKITTIPLLYRNLNRALEVLAVLSKYGLANWVSKLDVEFAKDILKTRDGASLARFSPEQRIRLALTELGPTFIKLGQILSTRPDLIGTELAGELESLRDNVPADPLAVVRRTIEHELKRPLEDLFLDFEETPLACASIGQVHRARLLTGEDVVVKVQRQGIEKKMRVDLEILTGLMQMAERVPEFKNYRPSATLGEFRRTLLRELDFARERRNMERFQREFRGQRTVLIPQTYPEHCSPRVLTMQRLEGVALDDPQRLASSGLDLDEAARRGARLFLEMIFTHGFYHADPHPGNFVLMEGNVIGLLDYGMVSELDEPLREYVEELLFALANGDAAHLTSVITRTSSAPGDLDMPALSLDITDFLAHYAGQPLNELDLGAALKEMTELIRRYHIMLPARIGMLLKVLMMLEGTARLANPRFSLMEVIQPYQRKLIWRRLSPARQMRKLRRIAMELEHLAEKLPRGLLDILQQVQSGKFDVHLDHRGLEPSVNRLVLGLLSSAMFVGSSMLLCMKTPPVVLGSFSFFGALGCLVSIGLGLRLYWAIRKSGHLDRRKD